MKRFTAFIVVISVLFLPFFSYAKGNALWIYIDLRERNLYFMKNNHVQKKYKITIGREDTPSPIGTWEVVRKAAHWGGGFGSRWMQLNVPWGIYGIHGTNRPYLIGQEASQGCIRLCNREVEGLYDMIPEGTKVVVSGPKMGFAHWQIKRLKEGNRGIQVYYVQQKLQKRGYYKGKVDGLFGPELKKAVICFQKANHLDITGEIYTPDYAILGLLFE